MSDLNVQLVRECFELHGFQTLTWWPHASDGARPGEAAPQLFVTNTRPAGEGSAPFRLGPEDLHRIARGAIEVRAWHADRFYPSVVESSAVLGNIASVESAARAAEVFGAGAAWRKVLVISELPLSPVQRAKALGLLEGLGLDHVLEFPAVLAALAGRISAHGHYAPSPSLQVLRLLKRYDLLRWRQLEFAFPAPAPPAASTPDEEDSVRNRT